MFNPLDSALTFLVTEGLKSLSTFLKSHGFPFEIDGWGSLAVAALVAALLVWANAFGAKLPATAAAYLPYLVQVILVLLPAIGIHAAAKRLQ